jgi:hypothetical protein
MFSQSSENKEEEKKSEDRDEKAEKALIQYSVTSTSTMAPHISVGSKLEKRYSERVNRWYSNPRQALIDDGYTDTVSSRYVRPELHARIVAYHSWPLALDPYLEKYGIESSWPSKSGKKVDKNKSIAGEIIFDGADTTPIIGVFQEAYDTRTGVVYHSCFAARPHDELVQQYAMSGFWACNFPPLGTENPKAPLDKRIAEDGSRVLEENDFIVRIADPKNKAEIVLYKVT